MTRVVAIVLACTALFASLQDAAALRLCTPQGTPQERRACEEQAEALCFELKDLSRTSRCLNNLISDCEQMTCRDIEPELTRRLGPCIRPDPMVIDPTGKHEYEPKACP
jgi:hypothetical protein